MEDGLLTKLAVGTLVPGVVGAGVLMGAWWRHRGPAPELTDEPVGGVPLGSSKIVRGDEPFWVMPALVSVLAAIMIPVITEARAFPPKGAEEWLPFVALAAGALELATRGARFPAWLRWALRAVLLMAIAAACARNMLHGSWTSPSTALWIGGFALVTMAATLVLERVLERTRGFTAPALLLIIVGGASQVLAIGYSSLKLGQSAGVVAAALAAATGVALVRRRFSLAFGGTFAVVAIVAAAVLAGNITTHTRQALYTSAIAAAALLPGLTLLKPLSRLRGWKRFLVLFTLAGLPIAGALAVVIFDELNRTKEEYDYSSLVTGLPPR